jgi:hypothetical protein
MSEFMTVRTRVVLVVLYLASLAGVGVWAQTQPQPRVISGSDLGFRVEGQRSDGTPTGRLVVRINGQWVEARFAVGTTKATQ